jgi:hypothetical protein
MTAKLDLGPGLIYIMFSFKVHVRTIDSKGKNLPNHAESIAAMSLAVTFYFVC